VIGKFHIERAELVSSLHKRVEGLPEGYFKRRMQARVKLLEEVPPEAFWALAIIIVATLTTLALGTLVWRR